MDNASITSNSKEFRLKTKFINELAFIPLGRFYGDGSIAWELMRPDGERLAVATVCMVDYGQKPKSEHVFIKNYSENIGVYEALHALGIVGEPYELLDAGYALGGVVHCPVNFDKLIR